MADKLELCKDCVHIFNQPVTRDEALSKLVSLLEAKNYVKETYGQAVLEREKIFPTGLPTEPVGIAIPHTDAEHVNRGAIAVGILPEPVVFMEMGSLDTEVAVSVISMLAIQDPSKLVKMLRQLAGSFQNTDFLAGLRDARDEETVLRLFSEAVPEVVELY